MPAALFIGLMSGTSLDGVDGVLIDLAAGASLKVLAHRHEPYSPALRQILLALNEAGGNELHRAALAGNAVADAYARLVHTLMAQQDIQTTQITAIGAHGQTVRHRPGEFDGQGYTVQLLNAALLAERCGIDVICDFRSRDVAAGGQGAPLVPAFHRAAFATPGRDVAVLNLGGIANLSFLFADGRTSGHDCGPGNVLLDGWCQQHIGTAFDNNGHWAESGRLHPDLLQHLLQDPYLQRSPPKSTGRDHFHLSWLHQQLQDIQCSDAALPPADVQCTLAHFTAAVVVQDVRQHIPSAQHLLVCGGGAQNAHLLQLIRSGLRPTPVHAVQDVCNMQPAHVEAAAFAWLAQAFLARQPANCTAVTGAAGPRLLGALYPAR